LRAASPVLGDRPGSGFIRLLTTTGLSPASMAGAVLKRREAATGASRIAAG